MSRNGGEERDRTASLPFTRAAEVLGETALTDGIPIKTVQRWRVKGVPAYRVMQLLGQPRQRFDSARPSQPIEPGRERDTADWEALMTDARGQEAFRKLARVFKSRNRHPKLWTAITNNLDAFEEAVEQAEKASPTDEKRQRARRAR